MDNSVLSRRHAGMRSIRFVAANVEGGPEAVDIYRQSKSADCSAFTIQHFHLRVDTTSIFNSFHQTYFSDIR